MNTIENQPAFPQFGMAFGEDPQITGGMTLRDWFAGQALAGYCAAPDMQDPSYAGLAKGAYHQADAMLAARSTFNDADNQREGGK